MTRLSNLPPGVSNRMVEEQATGPGFKLTEGPWPEVEWIQRWHGMTIGLQSLITAAYAYAPAGWPQERLAPRVRMMQEDGNTEREIAAMIVRYLQQGLDGDWS